MMIAEIKDRTQFGEFDYTFLMDCLSQYKKPRDQVTKLIKKGYILPVKKGLYVFGPRANAVPYSKEILANLIYGPSYISKEYALAYYGMIPERVSLVTSMTNKRKKYFNTPIGDYSYQYINNFRYSTGITQIHVDQTRTVLFATKEKALADVIWQNNLLTSLDDLRQYLLEDLRIDENVLMTLNLTKLRSIQRVYQNKTIELLIKYLEKK